MTANWNAGTRYAYPKGHGDHAPMLAQSATPALDAEYQRRVIQTCERMARDVEAAYFGKEGMR